jgi:ribosome-associated translation inhibitor RaiA
MLQVHWLDRTPSPAVEDRIRRWFERLSRYSDNIQNCQVWVESSHGHHRNGALFSVRIRLTVPGEEIAVEMQPTEEDVHVAVRKGFEAAKRKLQDHERRRRGDVKSHPRERGDASRRRQVPPRKDREGAVESPLRRRA